MSFGKLKNSHGQVARLMCATLLSSSLLAASATAGHADEALADLVEQVSPAVVTVLSSRDAAPQSASSENFKPPEGGPMEEFFKRFGPRGNSPDGHRRQPPAGGLGSGFILSPEGWVVTNHHVVEGADRVTVRLSDDREYEAEIVGLDEQTDLALLRIDAGQDLPHVELGNSDGIRVGEDVMAVGNPFGLGGTVTTGIVSAKGRNVAAGPYADFLQTDAAINKGNSGGPLFDMDGKVVGVNSAIYSPTGGSVGVGFAISSNIVDLIVDDLKDDGKVDRGWLGVSIQDVTPELSAALGLSEAKGALVASVVDGSPSDGKLKSGDVVLEFGGEQVKSSRHLPKLVAAATSGETSELRIFRNGKEETVNVRIGAFQSEQAKIEPTREQVDKAAESLGANVADLTGAERLQGGLDEDVQGAVITSLTSSGPAAKAGLQVGDVIVRLGNEDIVSASNLRTALEASEAEPALLLINRSGRQIFVAVDLT